MYKPDFPVDSDPERFARAYAVYEAHKSVYEARRPQHDPVDGVTSNVSILETAVKMLEKLVAARGEEIHRRGGGFQALPDAVAGVTDFVTPLHEELVKEMTPYAPGSRSSTGVTAAVVLGPAQSSTDIHMQQQPSEASTAAAGVQDPGLPEEEDAGDDPSQVAPLPFLAAVPPPTPAASSSSHLHLPPPCLYPSSPPPSPVAPSSSSRLRPPPPCLCLSSPLCLRPPLLRCHPRASARPHRTSARPRHASALPHLPHLSPPLRGAVVLAPECRAGPRPRPSPPVGPRPSPPPPRPNNVVPPSSPCRSAASSLSTAASPSPEHDLLLASIPSTAAFV
ncbi:hypothetical protein PR202_ga28307 [Eleusine coracana subsp. coracana]|uniref:Uncharacterized protein n=1 Tax=Eleusine coracana subsp. coracana TaxID=191504 RepID=A0AAV5DGT4_ELECO|nr:hypothetical protein PR202_ga28307 [Eleusine coracana subsp. coracana]